MSLARRGRGTTVVREVALHLGVAASYLAIALVHLRPLASSLTTAIPRGNREDALLHAWILNWTARQLGTDPANLFDSNSFFPFPRSLAYTEHFVPEALPVVPLARVSDNPILIYNIAFLAMFVIGGWGTFVLVRRLTGSVGAAWVGGAFACWFPAKRWTQAHPNTMAVHWVPFALWMLHRLLHRPSWAGAVLSGFFVALAALSSAYYSFYFPLLLVPAVLLMWWADRLAMTPRRALGLVGAAIVAAILVAPILAPYANLYPAERGDYVYGAWPVSGMDPAELLILDSWLWRWTIPASANKLAAPLFPGLTVLFLVTLALTASAAASRPKWSRLPSSRSLLWAGGGLTLMGLGLGFKALLAHHRAWQVDQLAPQAPWRWSALALLAGLALVAAAEGRRFPRALRLAGAHLRHAPRRSLAFATMVLLALLLAVGQQVQFFGYLGPLTPLHWLYGRFPTLANLRAPYRVSYLGMAFLAVLVGLGAARAMRWLGRRWGLRPGLVAVVLVATMQLEYLGPAVPPSPPPAPRAVDRWLAEQPGDFGIVELPQPPRMFQTARQQWRSVYHWKRRITGHNGFVPDAIDRLHGLANPVLGDAFLSRLLSEFPVRYLVLDLDALSPERRVWAEQERLPELLSVLEPVVRLDGVLVLRVLNGGEAGVLRRTFPRWMVAGRLLIDLEVSRTSGGTGGTSDRGDTADTGATARRRLQVRIGDVELATARPVPGQSVLEIELTPMLLPELVTLTVRGLPREGTPTRIRRIRFLHADGSSYP